MVKRAKKVTRKKVATRARVPARRAKALTKLVEQVDALWPNRSTSTDGWLGDAAHRKRKSDHNPNSAGVVQAQDITHDPKHGCDSYKIAEMFRLNRDTRIKYIISNKKIMSGFGQDNPAWVWRKYSGPSPHDKHVHVSVRDGAAFYDDARAWALDVIPAEAEDETRVKERPVLRRGAKGAAVKELQRLLGIKEDGTFGRATQVAVKAFQRKKKIAVDGAVGAYTWEKLRGED